MVLRLPLFLLLLSLLTACQEDAQTVKSSIYEDPCPEYFSLVSKSFDLGTEEFCISQDLMAYDSNSRLTVRRDSLYAVTPDHDDAELLCQSLGEGYDLVSMKEYQATAREVELLDENWSDGRIGFGLFADGKTSVKLLSGETVDGMGNNVRAGNSDAVYSWTKDYFNPYFTSGYDFDVKAGEFYTRNLPLVLINFPYDDVGKWFAPKGDYSQKPELAVGYAGLGKLWLNAGSGYIARGAFNGFPYQAEYSGFTAQSWIGFHCVYHP